MPIFRPKPADYIAATIDGVEDELLSNTVRDSFNTLLLGLGNLKHESSATDSIAAVFDLQGFTNFCKQIEPHLSVPLFLSKFLSWLMRELKNEMIQKDHGAATQLWSPLPFFVKFLGDGLLVLWDATAMSDHNRSNILISVLNICDSYKSDFLPKISGEVVDPPDALRCGVARGTVYSVGDNADFVGSCINMAARLQKLPGVNFAFNRRGFNLEDAGDFITKSVVIRKVAIRGIGDGELVGIRKSEFEKMVEADKRTYRKP